MNILNFFKQIKPKRQFIENFYGGLQNYPYSPIEHDWGVNVVPFDGEKTPHELGKPYEFYPDYYTIRARAWEAFLKTDIVQNAIRKYCLWIVGSGLKIQVEPVKSILKSLEVTPEQIKIFIETTENLFRIYSEMQQSSYNNECNLHYEAAETLKNVIIAGDMLCVLRFDGKLVSMETIDGRHVVTPIGSNYQAEVIKSGHIIVQGVELNEKLSHVAYYVRQADMTFERIPAYGEKSGRRQAWLIYGNKARKTDIRGLSLLASILETTAKMDRYKEATIGAAEENAKIPYTIEHDQFSTGENPMIDNIAAAFGKNKGLALETITAEAEAKATKIAQTTQKQTYNMPIGAKLKRNEGNTDVNFKDFYNVNIDIVYATLGIPPEVAMDKFGGAYSGSRAALKAWEHKMKVDRVTILKWQFYKPFYDYWLDINILQGNIQIPGYLVALKENNIMVLEAYRNCRFIGPLVPHIDPVKEVNAMRGKLGKLLEGIPLQTIEQIMEELNSGDFGMVLEQIKEETEAMDDFMVLPPTPGHPSGASLTKEIEDVIEDIIEEKKHEILKIGDNGHEKT
jgi:hypothetical protein